jgi:hypothetical protein
MSIKCDHDEYYGFCEECFATAATKSALDMGIPDYFLCGYCGCKKITAKEMEEHIVNEECDHNDEEVPFSGKPKC